MGLSMGFQCRAACSHCTASESDKLLGTFKNTTLNVAKPPWDLHLPSKPPGGFNCAAGTVIRLSCCRASGYFTLLNSARLFPRRIHGLADEHCGICTRARRELLRAAV